jgi:hypothetical protein
MTLSHYESEYVFTTEHNGKIKIVTSNHVIAKELYLIDKQVINDAIKGTNCSEIIFSESDTMLITKETLLKLSFKTVFELDGLNKILADFEKVESMVKKEKSDSKETYELTWNDCCCLTVSVDRALLTDEILNQINNFWSNADGRLHDEDGDLFAAVLKLLFITVITESFHSLNVIEDLKNESPDGWMPFDGSYGIELISFEELEIDTQDIDIERITE